MAKRRRTKRPYGEPHVPLDMDRARGGVRRMPGPGGAEYSVRNVRADKTYTCPGCHQIITVGTEHVVAWSEDSLFGVDAAIAERRHWHSACWQRAARTGR